eukprot:5708446-Prymnesium_polylepis.1
MPPIANDVGKYLSVPMAKTFQRFGVEQDDIGVVLEHDVNPGQAATNKTTLALFRADDFASFQDSATEFTLGDVRSGAEHLFVGLSNTELGRLYPRASGRSRSRTMRTRSRSWRGRSLRTATAAGQASCSEAKLPASSTAT